MSEGCVYRARCGPCGGCVPHGTRPAGNHSRALGSLSLSGAYNRGDATEQRANRSIRLPWSLLRECRRAQTNKMRRSIP